MGFDTKKIGITYSHSLTIARCLKESDFDGLFEWNTWGYWWDDQRVLRRFDFTLIRRRIEKGVYCWNQNQVRARTFFNCRENGIDEEAEQKRQQLFNARMLNAGSHILRSVAVWRCSTPAIAIAATSQKP